MFCWQVYVASCAVTGYGCGFGPHLSPLRQQFRDTDEVVADQIEEKVGGNCSHSPVFCLAHRAVLLPPSEQTLDHVAFAL